jgi:GntR family transcriptional regulator, transcriptional repressor for pyruvate dehydrogenase complex
MNVRITDIHHRPYNRRVTSGPPGRAGSEETGAGRVAAREPIFTAVSHLSKPDRVSEAIGAAIRDGRLEPGQALPPQQELADQFGVSRLVVREALRSLEATHAIEVRPGRGAFVSKSPGASVTESWIGWLAAHRDEVLELLSIRRALEELGARRAAERATDADVEALRGSLAAFEREMKTPTPNLERLVHLDVEFHDLVAAAAHSALLHKLVDEVAVAILDSRRAGFSMPRRPDEAVAAHRKLLAAISDHDPDRAAAELRAHLDVVIQAVRDQRGGPAPAGAEAEGV